MRTTVESIEIFDTLLGCPDELCLICNEKMSQVNLLSTSNEWKYKYTCPDCGEYRVNSDKEIYQFKKLDKTENAT